MKKKLIQQGLLDEKGKPNEKTPSDWYKQYVHYTHSGEAAKVKNPENNQAGDVSMGDISTAKSDVDNGDSPPKKKRKKDKKKKDKDREIDTQEVESS